MLQSLKKIFSNETSQNYELENNDIDILAGILIEAANSYATLGEIVQAMKPVFGEWQEGSNWEALIFGRHHNLTNLIIFVDVNGLQGFDTTAGTASMSDLKRHFEAFDMEVIELDGHSFDSLNQLKQIPRDRRVVCLLNTIKGKGISFMENRLEWHYLPLTDELYQQAIEELSG